MTGATDVRLTGIERTLRASRLFEGVEAAAATFAPCAIRRRFRRGEFIWHEGDPATSFTVIASGLIKICQSHPDGDNAIVALFGPRENIGDVAVVSTGSYPADAIAATEVVEILSIEKTPVLTALQQDVALAQALNRSLVEHSRALREKIRIMTAGPVEQRLAALLAHLVARFGDELDSGAVLIPVALSRTDLARLVGARSETTIRVMTRWQRAKLLSTTAAGFVIHDPSKFQE